MKIGVLTSSRADFGIYLPLLKALKADDFFNLEIIAFGTHLSNFHGYTLHQIEAAGFEVRYKIESMLLTDSADAIATAIGLTTVKFASFWQANHQEFDLIFCLGDRYEMFAAVMGGVPFGVQFAHLHGGETTLGAIDNVFRHAISHAAQLHFTATQVYADRLKAMLDESNHVYYVGALSLANINQIEPLSLEDFELKWGINLQIPTVLTTFHPETVNADLNENYAIELVKAIKANSQYQYLITMPNADTAGTLIREIFEAKLKGMPNVVMIENLGTQSYFTAMQHCSFLLGNTSSGIIEAASFGKYVVNLGSRQEGRAYGENVLHVAIQARKIKIAIEKVEKMRRLDNENIYFKRDTVEEIIKIVKLNVNNGK